jgi:phosphoribosylformimino-5-aminoimidazole carboxamide ribotide isomerase
MDLYPAIDLRGGRVVRLHQGDFAQETVYGDDPVVVAKSFADAGAPWVHVVDLDAAKREGSNRDLVVAVARAINVPVQTGGGVRDGSLLSLGIARVVVGSAAIDDPALVDRLAAAHPSQVAIGLDHRDGEVRTRGWIDGSGTRVDALIDRLTIDGVAAFVVTDIARDGVLAGPDVDGYRALVTRTRIPIVASGGVGSLDDLRALRDTGVAGVIVGKALYEGRFTIDEAVAACTR